jgi:hypothetical protein
MRKRISRWGRFHGKAIKRKLLDAEAATFFGHCSYALDAAAMTKDTRQASLLGPTAVAVHNNGDMTWQLIMAQADFSQAANAFFCQVFRTNGGNAHQRIDRLKDRSSRISARDSHRSIKLIMT